MSYAFPPDVFFLYIYETPSAVKVKDQRIESKAFGEWGAEIQGDVQPMWDSLSLLSPLLLYSVWLAE